MAIRNTNQAALEKITTGDMSSGGLLKPEQFSQFFKDVQQQSDVLQRTRAVRVDAPEGDIPRLSFPPESMQAVDEGESAAKQVPNQPSVPYTTEKVSLPFELTWEATTETVGDAENAIRSLFAQGFANDLERLASKGDESASGFEAINDGWLTIAQSRGSPVYNHDDAGDGTGTAQPVDKSLFEGMLGALDTKYKEAGSLAYLMSWEKFQSYKEGLTDRTTAAGDAILLDGDDPDIYSVPVLTPLAWPDDHVMLTDPSNLAYVIEDDVRVKSTDSSERNVMNDIEIIINMLAKTDYQVMDEQGVAIGAGVAAP
jgi:HK97 family phage major capsid protein